MKTIILTGMMFLLLLSCEKNNIEKVKIEGGWLESSQMKDTLVFDTQSFDDMFILNRGKELRDGYLLPKSLSGLYFYEIRGDSINLRWGFSSVYVGKNYYFNLDSKEGKLEIGNFFVDSLSSRHVLTFSKMQ